MSRETKEIIRCDRCGRVFKDGHYGIKFHFTGTMPTTDDTNRTTITYGDLCKRCYTFACRIHREITAPAGKNKEVKEDEASV